MNITRRKHSVVFRGLVLVLVLALALLYYPVGLVALADQRTSAKSAEVDFTYMTLSGNTASSRRVDKGASYTIPQAKIGGSADYVVGTAQEGTLKSGEKEATLKSSSVKVTLNNANVNVDGGKFTAAQEGTYVITYSYSYEVDSKTYTNVYSIEVVSELSTASINFKDNYSFVMPSLIDLSVPGAKDGETYKDLQLYLPEVVGEDGEKEDVTFYANTPTKQEGKYVVITATGGNNIAKVDVVQKMNEAEPVLDADGNPVFVISGENFADPAVGAGNYVVKYSFYDGVNFVTSTTKTVEVKKENYYKSYGLAFEFGSSWIKTAQTGVPVTLPTGTGVTSKNTDPAGEKVDVSYKVEVKHKAAGGRYQALDIDLYNADRENPVLRTEEVAGQSHQYLIDPTTFTPLENGDYTFIYTITDFYGNTVTLDEGAYELNDVTDDTNPTAVVFDASTATFDEDGNVTDPKDASDKLATNAPANAVVVYAIGMTDNISKIADSKLERAIYSNEGVLQFTIKDYDNYNLVFNYQQDSNSAYSNLLANNPLIQSAVKKAGKTIESDAAMLEWLSENHYLIVIDNGNISHLYELFKSTFTGATSVFGEADVSDYEKLQTELEKLAATEEGREKIASLGFAYLPKADVTQTFGATGGTSTSGVTGLGTGTYGIRYEATDAGENFSYSRYYMTIGTSYDNELPKITFPTTLQKTYVPTAIITFDVPTSTDNNDTRMQEVTMYRFLGQDKKPLEVKDKDGEKISTNDLADLWTALKADEYQQGHPVVDNRVRYEGEVLVEKYAAYHEKETDDGYVDLTDASASQYSIDLSQVENAKYLQIVAYVYDDFGNANMYAQTITINASFDQYAPIFNSVENEETEFNQGDTITLPTLSVTDDAALYMTYSVQLNHIDEDKNAQKIEAIGSYQDRTGVTSTGAGVYKVVGGNFVASSAGEYNVALAAIDSRGDTIVAFTSYTVAERFIIQAPSISAILPDSQTIELDEYGRATNGEYKSIEIPIPTVNYDISGSVTYDAYKQDKETFDDDESVNYIVYGVYEDKTPYNYSVTYGRNGSLTPYEDLYLANNNTLGDYKIVYTTRIFVYSKDFEYHELTLNGDGTSVQDAGGYFTVKDDSKNSKITIGDGVLKVAIESKTYTIKMEDDKVVIYDDSVFSGEPANIKPMEEATITSTFGQDATEWFEKIKSYDLTSKEYTITLQDTVGPQLAEYEYVDQVSVESFEEDFNNTITVYGISTKADASGIDVENSSVTLSWKLSNGISSSTNRRGTAAFSDWEYKVTGASGLNGTYTITYDVRDLQGNRATGKTTYTIVIGDNVAPTVKAPTDFVKDSYKIGSTLTIDLGKLTVTDNDEEIENPEFTVKLTNTSTGEEVKFDEDKSEGLVYYFPLDEVGAYTLTIEVDDLVGNTATETYKFEVTSATKDATKVYQVVGTVLIVISVLVLAGVIIYFIVSKVKLDKELKK